LGGGLHRRMMLNDAKHAPSEDKKKGGRGGDKLTLPKSLRGPSHPPLLPPPPPLFADAPPSVAAGASGDDPREPHRWGEVGPGHAAIGTSGFCTHTHTRARGPATKHHTAHDREAKHTHAQSC